MKKLHSFATLAVAAAGVIAASPMVNLIPSARIKTAVLAVAAAILAANGAVVANGHKDA
jgi:hypothetical protein